MSVPQILALAHLAVSNTLTSTADSSLAAKYISTLTGGTVAICNSLRLSVVIMLCLIGALLKSRMICQLSLLAAHYNYISSTLESVAARL